MWRHPLEPLLQRLHTGSHRAAVCQLQGDRDRVSEVVQSLQQLQAHARRCLQHTSGPAAAAAAGGGGGGGGDGDFQHGVHVCDQHTFLHMAHLCQEPAHRCLPAWWARCLPTQQRRCLQQACSRQQAMLQQASGCSVTGRSAGA